MIQIITQEANRNGFSEKINPAKGDILGFRYRTHRLADPVGDDITIHVSYFTVQKLQGEPAGVTTNFSEIILTDIPFYAQNQLPSVRTFSGHFIIHPPGNPLYP